MRVRHLATVHDAMRLLKRAGEYLLYQELQTESAEHTSAVWDAMAILDDLRATLAREME